MIIAICCVDNNWGLGRTNKETGKGELLFNLKKDLAWFKAQTSDSIVVCGYNTLLSFPGSKPLKQRSTICLCPEGVEREDCYCIHNFDSLVQLVKELAKTQNVFIIGGGMLYRSMLPYYDRIFVTKVDAEDSEATVFFSDLDKNPDFNCVETSATMEEGGISFTFNTYERKIVCDKVV